MTFESFIDSHCTTLPDATGDPALMVASKYLRTSGQVDDPVTQRRHIDVMRAAGLYFEKHYQGACSLKLRPYPV